MNALNNTQATAAFSAYAAVQSAGGIVTVWFDDESTYVDFKADGTVIVEHIHSADSFKIYKDVTAFTAAYGL